VVDAREAAAPTPDTGRALESLVVTAERAVVDHDDAVAEIVAATDRQHEAIAALRAATTASANAARGVAEQAVQLAAVADRLPTEVGVSRRELEALAEAVRELTEATHTGRGAVLRLDGGWSGVADSVEEIARAARRARVLAVNASIEAAYVEATGSGFGIVAERMRSLSTSTLDAARDVRAIVGATRAEVVQVIDATKLAEASCSAVAVTLASAIADFDEGAERGSAFATGVSQLATIADQQSAASTEIAASVQRLDALATTGASDARAAAHGIDAGVAGARHALRSGDLAAVVRGLSEAAVAAARGESGWRGVDAALESLATEFEEVSAALEESGHAALALETASAEIVAALGQLDRVLQSAVTGFDRAAIEVRSAKGHGDQVRAGIVAMHAATDRAGTIVEAVSEISAESGLLAINAAIEAARAGERGLGFTVIADEIGRLARGTQEVTGNVADAIAKLRERGDRLERASAGSAGQMDGLVERAASGRAAVDALRVSIAANLEHARILGETARSLGSSSATILAEIDRARQGLGALGREKRDRARLSLSEVFDDAQRIAGAAGLSPRLPYFQRVLERMAEEIEELYAATIAAGRTTLEGFRDTTYVELRGDEVAHLARFVDVRTAPRNGFVPPKYRTSSDAAIDRDVMALIDRTIAAEPAVFSMGVFDLNGFLIALPSRVSTLTDWSRNRAKKLLEDPITLRVARVGLGAGAEGSGMRRSWSAFERDGFVVRRVTPRPHIVLAYLQDTGDVFVNFGTPIYVGDVRVGTASLIVEASAALG
jgi:methyl-accepting chemotaxis protein